MKTALHASLLACLTIALAACGDSTGGDAGQDLAGSDAGIDFGIDDGGGRDLGPDSGRAVCPRTCPDGQNVVRWTLADGGGGCQCDPSPCGPGDAGVPFCTCATTGCQVHGVSCGTCDDVRSSLDCAPCP